MHVKYVVCIKINSNFQQLQFLFVLQIVHTMVSYSFFVLFLATAKILLLVCYKRTCFPQLKKIICYLLTQASIHAEKSKYGNCPPIKPDTVGPCVAACTDDYDCSGKDKCCPTACGGTTCSKRCKSTCSNMKCVKGQHCEVIDGCAQCVPCSPVCNMLCAKGRKCKIINGCAECVRVQK